MSEQHWTDEMYDEVFEATCVEIAHRRRHAAGFSIKDLEAMLETAYTAQGNDWDGHGHIWHVRQAASIAACEHCLAEWRKELDSD
jgi:hypothetical protein